MKKIIYTISMALCLMTVLVSCKEKDMSMKMNNPRNIKGVISYKRSFGDLNDAHMAVAKKIGVKPLKDREAAEKLGGKVVEIKSGDFYQIDSSSVRKAGGTGLGLSICKNLVKIMNGKIHKRSSVLFYIIARILR